MTRKVPSRENLAGLVIAATLTYAYASELSTQRLSSQRNTTYTADGAIDAVVQMGRGDVTLGVPLDGPEREASLRRGGFAETTSMGRLFDAVAAGKQSRLAPQFTRATGKMQPLPKSPRTSQPTPWPPRHRSLPWARIAA